MMVLFIVGCEGFVCVFEQILVMGDKFIFFVVQQDLKIDDLVCEDVFEIGVIV